MINLILYTAKRTSLRLPVPNPKDTYGIARLKSTEDTRDVTRVFLDRDMMISIIGITHAQIVRWIRLEFPNFLKVDDIINVNGEFYISVNAEDLT